MSYERHNLIPLAEPALDESDIEAMKNVIRSGWLKQGKQVEQFENSYAKFVGKKFCVAVNSGTAALHLALLAAGIRSGDEVVMPSYSYVSTANAALYVGARPVFAEIDPRTLTMDPVSAVEHISPNTKAMIIVHWAGLPGDLKALREITSDRQILLIEDAAQAHGALFQNQPAGSFGDISCFSFSTAKNMTTGEGGALLTDTSTFSNKARSLRNLGESPNVKNQYTELGFNYRMTDIEAALGLNQLRKLKNVIERKRTHLTNLGRELSDSHAIQPPFIPGDRTHVFTMYPTILLDNATRHNVRDLTLALANRGIEARGFVPIHKQPAYGLYANAYLPVTEKVSAHSLYLPAPATITQGDVEHISSSLHSILTE